MALDVMVGARQETAVDNSPIGTYRFSYNSGGITNRSATGGRNIATFRATRGTRSQNPI